MSHKQDQLYRARAYPYDCPPHSYCYHDGEVKRFSHDGLDTRTPVLAFGSNRSPEQLKRKFGHLTDQLIPVEKIILYDFDVVFSAHITSYGAIPAMLQHCPGTSVEVAISWLDNQQLEVMHQTELYAANYSFAKLEDITMKRDAMSSLATVYAYIGERGHYVADPTTGHACAIKCIPATNRQWPAFNSKEMLTHIHQISDHDGLEDGFILKLIEDVTYRRNLSLKLSLGETCFNYPYAKIA